MTFLKGTLLCATKTENSYSKSVEGFLQPIAVRCCYLKQKWALIILILFSAMWGFHDRLLTLRKALHSLLTSGDIWPAIYRRWRLQSHIYNTQFGLILDETEWQEEWKSVLKLASSEPRHPSNASTGSSGIVKPLLMYAGIIIFYLFSCGNY